MTFVCFDTTFGGTWACASETPPPPPPGSLQPLVDRASRGPVVIRSARVGRRGGVMAISRWLHRHLVAAYGDHGREVALAIRFDVRKTA